MRHAHPFYSAAMALLMGGVGPQALAQSTKPTSAAPAADAGSVFSPAAPTLPLQHRPLPVSGAIVAQPGDWRAANAAVGEFPRGHGDVLKWEKAQATATGKAAESAAPAMPATPAHGHHQHGGHE